MYKAIIDRGETYLFFDRGTEIIDYKKDIMGFLVNNENIINLMENIPISKYYVKDVDGSEKLVSKKQATWLYEQLIDSQKNNLDGLKKPYVAKKKIIK